LSAHNTAIDAASSTAESWVDSSPDFASARAPIAVASANRELAQHKAQRMDFGFRSRIGPEQGETAVSFDSAMRRQMQRHRRSRET
jgi:hypothetical protein